MKHQLHSYLRHQRTANGLSQGDVARLLHYRSPQIVSNWERRLCVPPLKSLKKLKKLYRLNDSRLMKLWLQNEKNKLLKHL